MTPEVIKTLIEIANEQQRVMAITRCPPKGNLHTNPDFTLEFLLGQQMESFIFRSCLKCP